MLNEIINPLSTILGVIVGSALTYFTGAKLKSREIALNAKHEKNQAFKALGIKFLSQMNWFHTNFSLGRQGDRIQDMVQRSYELKSEIEVTCPSHFYDAANSLYKTALQLTVGGISSEEQEARLQEYLSTRAKFIIVFRDVLKSNT